MLENQKIRPAQVIGPLGEPLTLESLPPASTTRWVVMSALCHTTIWPDGRVAGLGENDCAPLMATTLIVTTPEPLVGGVGLVGFPLPLE